MLNCFSEEGTDVKPKCEIHVLNMYKYVHKFHREIKIISLLLFFKKLNTFLSIVIFCNLKNLKTCH